MKLDCYNHFCVQDHLGSAERKLSDTLEALNQT